MPPDAADCADRQTVPVADIADRVGEALEDVGEAVHRLQTLIAPLVLEAATRNPVHLRELQDFDHISQKLKNLADFLGALALILPDHWRLNPGLATNVLTLADLSAHLSFAEKSGDASHEPGDFELFN